MNQVLTIVLPVFAFLALGWLAAITNFLGREVEKGLSTFALWVAIPALLFRLMAESELDQGSAWELWGAFFLAASVAWVASSLVAVALKRPAETSASFAMGATFGNTVMMGIPLSLATFGEAAALPLALLTAVHAPVLWLASTVQIEWARSSGSKVSPLKLLRDLFVVLAKNPIIMALLLGLLWRITGLGLTPIVHDIISKLGQAAIPCALFALGMSLAAYSLRGEIRAAPALTIIKLGLMPLCVWVTAYHIFELPPAWAGTALILAALPTGLNGYLFAVKYDCGVASVSATIALSTLISVATLAMVIAYINPSS
ncbi:MAG: AEC family transporter [Hyphomicrobiales bacterium]